MKALPGLNKLSNFCAILPTHSKITTYSLKRLQYRDSLEKQNLRIQRLPTQLEPPLPYSLNLQHRPPKVHRQPNSHYRSFRPLSPLERPRFQGKHLVCLTSCHFQRPRLSSHPERPRPQVRAQVRAQVKPCMKLPQPRLILLTTLQLQSPGLARPTRL